MGPFWTSFFEHLKDCGRNAAVFYLALAGVFLSLIAGLIIYETGLYRYLIRAAPFMGFFVLAWTVLAIRRLRERRRQRWQFQKLSEDELRVARSKLRKDRSG